MNPRALKWSIVPALVLGIGVGSALGAALHSVAEGVALGTGIGLAFAISLYRSNRERVVTSQNQTSCSNR